jgi:release factor glutamine methyltransferase
MNVREALVKARVFFADAGLENASLDAEVLLMHLLGIERAGLYMRFDYVLTLEEAKAYRCLIERRVKGEPVAYLTGHKEFMGMDFIVNPAVLVPRPETEILVERALKFLEGKPGEELLVLDIGTGSGAIAVSMARMNSRLRVYAVDCSRDALVLAQHNAAIHGVAGRIHFFHGDLLYPLSNLALEGKADLIAANLPYVPSGDISGLPVDVRSYEPQIALNGGLDGLDIYRRLLSGAGDLLKSGGLLMLEIGPGQADVLVQEITGMGMVWCCGEIVFDYAGRERVVLAEKE